MAASLEIKYHNSNGSSIAEYIYDNKVLYEKGDFRYSENAGTLSSPFNPHSREPSPHCLLTVSDENVKALEPETVLKLVIPGKDGRTLVDTSSKYPYCIISQLRMGFPGDSPSRSWSGSGTMVGPHHVLTCAHNVFNADKKTWAEWVEVYPAKKGENAPFGKGEVTKVYVFKDWTEKGDSRFDIALLILKQSIGNLTGWGGITCTKEENLKEDEVHITGYPGDKSPGEMWTMSHKIQGVYDETFKYIIDTYPGQSGSPVWAKKWENPTIFGVHTLGSPDANYGVRISQKKFIDLLATFISKTYKISSVPDCLLTQNPGRFFGLQLQDGREVYMKPENNAFYAAHRGKDANTERKRREFSIIPVNGKEGYFELKLKDTDVYVSSTPGKKISNGLHAHPRGQYTNTEVGRWQFRFIKDADNIDYYNIQLQDGRDLYVSSHTDRLHAEPRDSKHTNTELSRRLFKLSLLERVHFLVSQNPGRFFGLQLQDGREVYMKPENDAFYAAHRGKDANTERKRREFSIISVDGKEGYFELKLKDTDVYVSSTPGKKISNGLHAHPIGQYTNTEVGRRQFRFIKDADDVDYYNIQLQDGRDLYVSSNTDRLHAEPRDSKHTNTDPIRRLFKISLC